MPLTAIEAAMFSGGGTHAVTAFTIANVMIALSLAPWADEAAQALGQDTNQTMQTRGVFQSARLLAREVMDDDAPGDQEPPLPWDIIGFDCDCYDLGHDRWRFVLQCREIEYVWESAWPEWSQPTERGATHRKPSAQYGLPISHDGIEERGGFAQAVIRLRWGDDRVREVPCASATTVTPCARIAHSARSRMLASTKSVSDRPSKAAERQQSGGSFSIDSDTR